jgi:hypothetical protein
VTDLVFKRLAEKRQAPRYRWDVLLNPAPMQTNAVASQIEQNSRTIQPKTDSKAVAATAEIKSKAETQKPGRKNSPRSKS